MPIDSSRLLTIKEILQSCIFEIPEYQRGYAWGHEQWKDLWDDISYLGLRPHGEHYGGALMLRPLGESAKSSELFEVIDGQQRLTTIAILLQALSHPHIKIQFRNNEYFQTYFDYYVAGKADLASRLGKFSSFYGTNMKEATVFFTEKVRELDEEGLAQFTNDLLNRFKLFVLPIQPEFDIHVAFETINNRGKKLTLLERLKNRLIYLTSIAQDKEAGSETAATIYDCWKSIYHWLGKGSALLDDDAFLRAHSLGWFRYQKEANWLEGQIFDKEFSAHNRNTELQKIADYVRSLENASAWWYHLNDSGALPSNLQKQLQSFNRTSFSGFHPLLLWALIRLGTTDTALVSSPSTRKDWSVPFELLLVQAERFAVLIFMGNDRRSNYAQSDLNWVAYWLAHPAEKFYAIDNIAPDAPTTAEDSVIFAADYIQSRITPQEEDEETGEFPDQRFQWSGYFIPEQMRDVAADRLRSKNGFYGWDLSKRIMYEWEQMLRGDKGQIEKRVAWEKFSWDDSVEHIYPQNPDSHEWNTAIKFDGRTSKVLRNTVVNSLGNLLLLSVSRNALLSNNPYRGGTEPKKAKSVRYQGGSYSEMQVFKVCKDWNILAIAARGIALMRFAEKRWDFQLVDPDAGLDQWLPILFGDHAAAIHEGRGSDGTRITSKRLRSMVSKFESN